MRNQSVSQRNTADAGVIRTCVWGLDVIGWRAGAIRVVAGCCAVHRAARLCVFMRSSVCASSWVQYTGNRPRDQSWLAYSAPQELRPQSGPGQQQGQTRTSRGRSRPPVSSLCYYQALQQQASICSYASDRCFGQRQGAQGPRADRSVTSMARLCEPGSCSLATTTDGTTMLSEPASSASRCLQG